MPFDLPITSLAALLNGMIFLVLTVRVITYRRGNGIVLGENDDRVLTKRVRGQANAAEQMPLALVLLALCELQGVGPALLLPTALIFTAGRLLHGAYFSWHGLHWRLRFFGMALTLTGQTALLTLILWTLLS